MDFWKDIKEVVDSLCDAIKIAYEKSEDADRSINIDDAVRAEICFFILYLMSDNGQFDEDEFVLAEQAVGFRTSRDTWDEALKLFRVDSEENYLSQPPETIAFMQQIENALHEIGEHFDCVSATMDGYKAIGMIIVNSKGYTDEGRIGRLKKFVDMVEEYQNDNAANPEHRTNEDNREQDRVLPSRKGVAAPRKS